jgi:hypothetical protein
MYEYTPLSKRESVRHICIQFEELKLNFYSSNGKFTLEQHKCMSNLVSTLAGLLAIEKGTI